MNGSDKTVSSNITLGELLDSVTAAPEAPLVFLYEGHELQICRHCCLSRQHRMRLTEPRAGGYDRPSERSSSMMLSMAPSW